MGRSASWKKLPLARDGQEGAPSDSVTDSTPDVPIMGVEALPAGDRESWLGCGDPCPATHLMQTGCGETQTPVDNVNLNTTRVEMCNTNDRMEAQLVIAGPPRGI